MGSALFAHGVSSAAVTLMGSVPNTIYAENIAVMGLHNHGSKHDRSEKEREREGDHFIRALMAPYSVFPYVLAAIFAILLSFVGVLPIPDPVKGGMELFLFGIISAPGIQLLVDQQVNYRKASNQIITAAVLITGISEFSISILGVEMKGMSLGFLVGVTLNGIVWILKSCGHLNDSVSFDEFLTDCLSAINNIESEIDPSIKIHDIFTMADREKNMDQERLLNLDKIRIQDLYNALTGAVTTVELGTNKLSSDFIRDIIRHSTIVTFSAQTDDTPILRILSTENTLRIEFDTGIINKSKSLLPMMNMYLNDYRDSVDTDENGSILHINESGIQKRKIKEFIHEFEKAVREKKLSIDKEKPNLKNN